MNQHNRIEIVDRDGWRRELTIEKTIVHIGSDPRNDIVLETGRGTGVAPLHAQLIIPPSKSGCQLVNLGDRDILLGSSGDQALPPRSVANVSDGAVLKVGDFILVFRSNGVSAEILPDDLASSGQRIGLSISLPQTRLGPNRSLDGVVTVRNLGNQGGVQFNLELEGLEPDCYDIEPGPILSPGVEKEVSFHIYHQGNKPLAGDYRITVYATAPRAYLGEQATVSQVIQVLPFYRHRLRLLPLTKAIPAPRAQERQLLTPPEWAPRTEASAPSQTEDWWAPTPIVAKERVTQAEAAASPTTPMEWAAKAEPIPQPQAQEPTPDIEALPTLPVAVEPTPQAGIELPPKVEEKRLPEVHAGPQPQAEERQAETEAGLPTEKEWTPAAEMVAPTQVEDRWKPDVEATPQPQVEVRQAETEAGLPVRVEEEHPQEEARAETLLQARRALEPETTSPTPMEDWWKPEAEAEPKSQTEARVLKLKASPPPKAKTERAPEAKTAPPMPVEDWWMPEAETEPKPQTEVQRVLKLKASPTLEAEELESETIPKTPVEDWWTPEAEAEKEQQTERRRVLKLKASPPRKRRRSNSAVRPVSGKE